MAINFSTSDRWIKGSSATNYYQNGTTSITTGASTSNIGFYDSTASNVEHMRFDDYGIVTNVYGSPAIVLRKTEGGATGNQNPIPTTKTYGSLPTIDVRTNVGTRASQLCFTAPVTGTYRWSCCALMGGNAIVTGLLNGGSWYEGIHVVSSEISYLTQAWEMIINLSAGDQLQVYSRNGGNVWGDNGWTTMTASFIK
jgi:hypothetical protein